MALKTFMPMFTGEEQHFRLYEFTPDHDHDPDQRPLPLPRVLWVLDGFPVNDGQTILVVRDSEATSWDGLSDDVVGALARVSMRLRRHMRQVLTEAIAVTLVNSETSIPEPHTLFVPVHERKDPQRLWDRTYADDTHAPADQLTIAQNRLTVPDELKQELDSQLADVYWSTQSQQPTAA